MKIGNLTKSAMIVALMMGQVTPPTNIDYYEDDGDFNTVSTLLSDGWGWGMNQAHAGCDILGMDDCTGGSPEPSDPGGDDTMYGGDGGSDSGDTSGGGAGPAPEAPAPEAPAPAPVDPNQLPPLVQCQLDALIQKNNCITTAEALLGVALVGCAFLIEFGPIAVIACGAIAGVGYSYAKGECEEQYLIQNYQCTVSQP